MLDTGSTQLMEKYIPKEMNILKIIKFCKRTPHVIQQLDITVFFQGFIATYYETLTN
jgi:hypothetical protein